MIGATAAAGSIAADMAEALAGVPEAEEYPLDALPDTMRAAVDEVLAAVQCPPALAGMSALAVLSTAVQAHVDVARDETLRGPTSLYLLAIASSGERKSTVDRMTGAVLGAWERSALDALRPALLRASAAREAWEARRAGLRDAIRHAQRQPKPTEALAADLAAHLAAEPERIREPALVQTDATPEALAWALHVGWPAAGLMTAEGGLVLGGHGMQRESIMRHLALLNALWDGAEHRVARRTQPSYLLTGRRLTLWVQVQPAALAQYLADHGALARGTGWLARCLIARPPTTQGTRAYRPPAAGQPALAAYHSRISELLSQSLPLVGDRLCPRVLMLSGAARTAWIAYHDEVEGDLAPGGELAGVRDAAAKAAENVARIAALLAVYDGRDEVSADDVERAAALVSWHLCEARRVFASAQTETPVSDAELLVRWIMAQPDPVTRRDVQWRGPLRLRYGARLDAAIAAAEAGGRLRTRPDGMLEPIGGADGAR